MIKKMYKMDEETCEDVQAHLGRAASHIRHAMELLSDCTKGMDMEQESEEHEEEEHEEETPDEEEEVKVIPSVVKHDRMRKQIILRY